MPLLRSRRLLTTCVLGAAVLSGCKSTNTSQSRPVANVASSGNPTLAPQNMAGATKPVQPTGSVAPSAQEVVPAVATMPAAPALQTAAVMPAALAMPPEYPPIVQATMLEMPPEPPKADAPAFPRGAPKTPQQSFVEITADPSFGHDPDYTWISGEVQKWRNDWRLRYASVDEVDPYGGSLHLAGDEFFSQLRDGEHFKLQGRLDPNGGKADGPVFIIEAVLPAAH